MSEQFSTLLEKFLAEELNSEELPLFLSAAKDPANHDVLYEAIKAKLEGKAYEDLSLNSDIDNMFQQMLAKVSKPKVEDAVVMAMPVRKRFFTFSRLAAAAAILIVMIAGAYFLFPGKNEAPLAVQTLQQRFKNDVSPGGNRATLTLANGSTIILDSAQNGSLAIQGNTQVVKPKDGKLIYQKENNNPATVQYNTITTPRGGQYQLTLADGSQVWLNAASSITFPTSFVGDKREVKITGEAYFEVAHNAAMPFHMSVNNMEVEVLGTHFNVNAYEDEASLKVTLLEGSVEVKNKSYLVKIKPGQQASVSNNAESLGNSILVQTVDIDKVIAWKNGLFVFDNTDLATIMRQVSRWYDVEVAYDGKLTDARFGGGLSKSLPLSSVLKLMEANGVRFKLEGKVLRVIP